jgi:outer membrane biosynthesis protein TonB
MKKGFFTSVAFHVIILIAVLFGMPKVKPFEIEPSEAITVDISEISDATKMKAQTKAENKPAPKPAPKESKVLDKTKPAPKVAEEKKLAATEPTKADPPPPKPEPKPEPPKPEPPPEPKKVEPLPPDQDALNNLLEADQKAIDDKRKADELKKKADEKKKKIEEAKKLAEQKKADDAKKLEAEKKKRKLDMAQLDQLLNKENTDAASTLEKKDTSGDPEKAQQDVQGDSDKLQATLQALLQKRFNDCWSKPPAAIATGVTVTLAWKMDRSGNVIGQPTIVGGETDATYYDVTVRSAVSAVMGCQPYTELLKYDYEEWRDPEWTFVP